ncbi:MAG: ParB N-terminal domain-containing protein [Proteobacteria bacterium]|nr:ParB N-terminal domain-containing protein [Pseudomonadota bacterium]
MDIADIIIGDRLRPLDPAHVKLLADSMARQRAAGLPPTIAPIEVSRSGAKFILVAGWHRLEAARMAGFTTIEARVMDADADARRLREVEENLCRHELTPLDRAFFVEELCRLVGGLNAPKTKSNLKKNLADQSSATIALPEEVAERVKLSRRTIYYDLQLAEALKSVRDELAGLPIAASQSELKRLSRLDDKKKRAVVAELRAGKTFTEATASKASRAQAKGKAGAAQAVWSKMSAAEQDEFLWQKIKGLPERRRNALCRRLIDGGLVTEA